MNQINGSIVLYNNKKEQLYKAINSFLDTELSVKLYLIDNSLNDDLRNLAIRDNRIEYIFNKANLGYGTAHNIAMRKSIAESVPYHLVFNPDIYFKNGVLENIFAYMESNIDVGHLMPKILFPDGQLQRLCKLLPTPLDLFVRRFLPLKSLAGRINYKYELQCFDYKTIEEIPFLSGCFMFFKTDIIKNNCLFDEKYFMYLEDADITRRISKIAKTIYYPHVSIIHEYQRGAHKNNRLMWIFIQSVFIYFSKYGWIFDNYRKMINKKALMHLKTK